MGHQEIAKASGFDALLQIRGLESIRVCLSGGPWNSVTCKAVNAFEDFLKTILTLSKEEPVSRLLKLNQNLVFMLTAAR